MIAYWGIEANNFGDVLNRNILDHFGIEYEHTIDHTKANLFAIGSVARLAGRSDSVIMGSGVIRKNEKLNPYADWRFVRGPLTANQLKDNGGKSVSLFCDLAMFLPELVEKSESIYDVGIVPHYQHYHKMKKLYPEYKIINVNNTDPLSVAAEITSCKKIISSSLHGIICAHAYGIPAAHARFGKLHGDGAKFVDYYAGIKTEYQQSSVESPIYSDAAIFPNFDEVRGKMNV